MHSLLACEVKVYQDVNVVKLKLSIFLFWTKWSGAIA